MMTESEIAWKTLDYFRRHGGLRHRSSDGNRVCAGGALTVALCGQGRLFGTREERDGYMKYQRRFVAAADEMFPKTTFGYLSENGWENLPRFNDASQITKEMVEQVMEKVAIQLDEVIA